MKDTSQYTECHKAECCQLQVETKKNVKQRMLVSILNVIGLNVVQVSML